MSKIYELETFIIYALNAGFTFDEVCKFSEHYQNLLDDKTNLNNMIILLQGD